MLWCLGKKEEPNAMKPHRVRSRRGVIFALLMALLFAVVVLGASRGNLTRVTVDFTDQRGSISSLVYGSNHRYAYNGFGMQDPQTGQAYPEFMEEVRQVGLSAVRFPGGTIANTYHWKRAIGPTAERERNIHSDTGEPLSNEYGPDEHARFAEQAGAVANMVVNFGSGDAAEAADWVEYMNAPVGTNPNGGIAWAAVRAANGHPEPYSITYWEVGNEMEVPAQRYWIGQGSAAEIASKYAFGGTTQFSNERVGKYDDHQASAALSEGSESQVFYAKYPPVQPDSQSVFVDGEEWKPVADLTQTGRENVYQFEPNSGRILFGNGTNGNTPPKGATVTISYVSGPHDGFVDFYEAMKSVDPSIKVCSGLDLVEFLAAMGSTNPYDCQVVHSYSGPFGGPQGHLYENLTAGEVHDRLMLIPEERAAQVANTKEEIRRYAGSRAEDIEVVVSEYGLFFFGSSYTGPTDRYLLSQDQALYVAQSIKQWIELGVSLANKHSLVDFDPAEAPKGSVSLGHADQAVIGPKPYFTPSATARVFELFTSTMGDEVVASSVANNPERRISDGRFLSALQTVASTDREGNVYLVVINRDREKNVAATVEIPGYRHDGSAIVRTLNGSSYLSYNTPEEPDKVFIEQKRISVDPSAFNHTFPAHSVTAIKLDKDD